MPIRLPLTSSSSANAIVVATPGTVEVAVGSLRHARREWASVRGVVLAACDRQSVETGGLPVLGTIADLEDACRTLRIDEALVSLPGAMGDLISEVRRTFRRLGVRERFLPAIDDVLSRDPEGGWSQAFRPDYAALIGREPRKLDEAPVRKLIRNRRVLITGAGGSIGSEIARLCAAMGPSQIILMDRAENPLFEIDRDLAHRFSEVVRTCVLHDVVDARATLNRFRALEPEIVFHTAAHKHVPMMQDHPGAAVENNFFGTKSVLDAAIEAGAANAVMISTDKAVNPTSAMGATKFLAEQYVRASAGMGLTTLSIVRFGNVLGSACSVLPIWSRQISDGGPVTLTHEEMTRYFMTIPEAASLVLQAAAIEEDGMRARTFVLDMGEPVRIRELAARFIQAHGLSPRWPGEPHAPGSIDIRVTGVRPGEKLHEELAHQPEELKTSPVPGVLEWCGPNPGAAWTERLVADLAKVRRSENPGEVLATLSRWVPTLLPTPTVCSRLVGAA